MTKIYNKVVNRLKNQYKENNNTKVNEKCICPACGDEFIKIRHNQNFCGRYGESCHEYYWNLVGHNNAITFDIIEKINN